MRVLGLSRNIGDIQEAGLVLIQIDALSKKQLQSALSHNKMPFLKSLLTKEEYKLHSWYAGVPCSTPVVQSELFYGVKGSIVSFSFRDRLSGQVFVMYNPQNVNTVEDRLAEKNEPLLAGGSAYSDVLTGGASETHFCVPALGAGGLFRQRYPIGFILLILLNAYSVIRTAALMVIEFGLAIYDFFGGVTQGQDLWKELKFVPSRVVFCTLFRELITIGAKIDIARGLSVIHVNFMGYHEQSHRRGASSLFAHWTLKGIDDAIERIWKAAHRTAARDYSVWLYSDHGQADAIPYHELAGKTIQRAVADVFKSVIPNYQGEPIVEALGPMGHAYFDYPQADKELLAKSLVNDAQVPVVLAAQPDGRIRVWTREGSFMLVDNADRLFDTSMPFYDEMLQDFLALFRHPDCGDFVILGGTYRDTNYYSFAVESGAHGGITPQEFEGFTMLPSDVQPDRLEKGYIRAVDLRDEALYLLKRRKRPQPEVTVPATPAAKTLRIMSYNVHSCVGIDGVLSPARIARVISQYRPHIVAMQDLDVCRGRTSCLDQAKLIAGYLKMDHHFHATLQIEEESFGEAVLSVYPLHLYKRASLLRHPVLSFLEPRGAIWVQATFNGKTVQIINTHLGLMRQERLIHTEELLGEDWLTHPECRDPVILCGDFNAMPGSRVIQRLQSRLTNIRTAAEQVRGKGARFGRYPLIRQDHIFVSADCRVVSIDVCDSYLSRLASDHRPLLAEIEFT